MIRVYLLIICNPENKYEIYNIFTKLNNVVNVDMLYGPYDIIVEIIFETMDDLRRKLQKEIKNIDSLMSTLTLIQAEDMYDFDKLLVKN
ncbi:MAG TPA: Lrp/AsnC ligand binding domain-containing protein [Nitrososphaeraceae archaeon]|nr:Lrp/AsnC ligand binding domain-containing protein [Nitrososphaeraceae archaeon]